MKPQQQRYEDKDKGVITTVGDKTEPILHLDLTIEILIRLPAKSVFRFRCVSKHWCAIIRSRSFTDLFMSISLRRPRLSLGYCIFHHGNNKPLFYFSSPLHHPQVPKNPPSMVSETLPLTYMGLFNSVRGIILISLDRRHFVICNPTTRQVIRLPDGSNTSNICYMFLGYNPSNDQYKILRKIRSREDQSVQEHSVCTLETGQESLFSSWRHVESNILHCVRGCTAVCINGVVYYGAGTKSSKRFVVMSFNVGSERLRHIQGPNEEEYCTLINYRGKLACFSVNIYHNSFSLCVLDDVKEQVWSTKTIVPSTSFYDLYWSLKLYISGTTDAGEIIFVSALIADAVEIFYYDLKKNDVRRRVLGVGDIRDYDEFMCSPDHGEFFCPESLSRYIYRRISISCDHVENIIIF
ncbi:hypothetical protein EUTSA_v10017821mg [Eutrema salsugineum]|uniref:F-box domain-containing protein n=1 Tax=Eutrema salsugineum TaxID=72664 RepID=V4MJ29_EUTSA|nr:hypothetical protein EUTSA_v10017821mg [Eutrema salsugineum]